MNANEAIVSVFAKAVEKFKKEDITPAEITALTLAIKTFYELLDVSKPQ